MIRTFDLFCGVGGSSYGALAAGATPVAALDMWNLAIEAYRLNFPEAVTYCTKAESLSPHRILEDVGRIDLLLASPECTSHSFARGSKPKSEASMATAFEVIRFVKVLRPRWVVVENVPRTMKWVRFRDWHKKLEDLGYKTAVGVLNAQFHGTPQSRRRLFIVGDTRKKPSLPPPRREAVKPVASILGLGEPEDKPWKFSPLDRPNRAAATIQRAQRAIQVLGKDTEFIMVYYGNDGIGGFQTLDRPLRTVTTLDRFAYVRPNGNGYEMRMLQPPKLTAAMGFPDKYQWPKCIRRDKIKLIGNAVCPPVMRDVVARLITW